LSYRNDHDAALSRIDALEQELAATRDETARDHERIAMLERELAERQRREPGNKPRAPRRSQPPRVLPSPSMQPPTVTSIDELDHRGPEISRVALALLVGLAVGAIAFAWFVVLDERAPAKPAPTTCSVSTTPRNARVIGIDGPREVELGVAPVELRFDEWGAYRKIQFRIAGYDPLTIDPPSPGACSPDAYDLLR